MALYKSLENDVTSFFLAQGSLFETLLNSLCCRVAAIEASHEAALVAAKQHGSRKPSVAPSAIDMAQVAHLVHESVRPIAAAVEQTAEQVGAVAYKLEGVDLELDRMSRASDKLFQMQSQLKHDHEAMQRHHDDALDKLALRCTEMQQQLTSVQLNVPDMDALEEQWLSKVQCGLSQSQLVTLAHEMAGASVACQGPVIHARAAIDTLLTASSSEPPMEALTDLQHDLAAIVHKLDAKSSVYDDHGPVDPKISAAMAHALKRVRWSMWAGLNDGKSATQTHLQVAMLKMDAMVTSVRSHCEHLQSELDRFAAHERQLELHLAACPRQEDILAQLSALQSQLTADLSNEAALASIDDLRLKLSGLPTSDSIQCIVQTLDKKADKDDMLRRLEQQNAAVDDAATLGLSKIPLKCLSCDQYLPKHQTSAPQTYHHQQMHPHSNQTHAMDTPFVKPPVPSPRHVLKPIVDTPSKRVAAGVRPKSSNLHGGATSAKQKHFVQDYVSKIAPSDPTLQPNQTLPSNRNAVDAMSSTTGLSKSNSMPLPERGGQRPQSCATRTVTLAFQFPDVPPINVPPASDLKRYSFYPVHEPANNE
ncbi:Aste57867_11200 [Aphanomyces stellatus]|uniref:Aste57867_11200 protein n=1 Tax=Aphanomyces stellatus TaxID=120398 RepID=A0A485KSG1_9STRA|nr:hypothetical protein As57867_011158 [Aphanomyces stellatus]VFT88067.1 Aste57867_11200 [Aphanomyces stellatus]